MTLARLSSVSLALVTLVLPLAAGASCGSAFCMVNTNWGVQGVWNEPGTRVDLRYEYIDQDQPRTGTRNIGVGAIPRHHDEVSTINRNFFTTVDYGFSPEWGVSVVVPWIDRSHRHVHNHHGKAIPESWNFSDLGDVRVIGRYQLPLQGSAPDRAGFGGLTFGVEVPTGKIDVANDEGNVAERTLQPGSGTTDALVGAYYRQALPLSGASWFAQANGSLPLDRRRDFAPGNQFNVDVGYRQEVSDRVGLLLQVNAQYKARDRGAEAESDDSGDRTVSLSPGVSVAIGPSVQAYAFVQVPVYQRVNGVQLTADWSAAVGVTAQF